MQKQICYSKLWMWLSWKAIFLEWWCTYVWCPTNSVSNETTITCENLNEITTWSPERSSFGVYRKWRNIYWRKSSKPQNIQQHLSKSPLLPFPKLLIKWFALVEMANRQSPGIFSALLYQQRWHFWLSLKSCMNPLSYNTKHKFYVS